MKKIALTGASGIIGSSLRKHFQNVSFYSFDGDIRDNQAVKKFCRESVDCDAFLHLAALVPKQIIDSDPIDAFNVNVQGTLNVLEGLRQLRDYAPWLFFASSSHVYASSPTPIAETSAPDPFTLYGLTKLQGEQWCSAYNREFGLSICIGRIFSFSHPRQPNLYFIPAMIHKIRNAEVSSTLKVSGLNGQRDFLTVSQICQCIESLISKKHEGIINIGTGVGMNLVQMVKKIAQLLGRHDLNVISEDDAPNYLVADASQLSSVMGGALTSDINSLLLEMINEEV